MGQAERVRRWGGGLGQRVGQGLGSRAWLGGALVKT